MIIQIDEVNEDTYRADILDLPGSPMVGSASTPEEAVALAFILNKHNLRKWVEVDHPMFNSLTIHREY
jgi:hypothetical protein